MAQVDCFLKLGRIEGTGGPGHEGWIELGSYQFGCSNTALTGRGGARGTGKPILSDLTVGKMADKATPLLQQACATGEHFDKATLDVVFHSDEPERENGGPAAFLMVELHDVTVTSSNAAGVSGSTPDDGKPAEFRLTQAVGPYDWQTSAGDNTFESVSMKYVKILWTYQDNKTGDTVKTGYDLKANKKV